jgi:hypothetical protein
VAKIDPNKIVCWQLENDIPHVNNIHKHFSIHLLSNLMKDVSNNFFIFLTKLEVSENQQILAEKMHSTLKTQVLPSILVEKTLRKRSRI